MKFSISVAIALITLVVALLVEPADIFGRNSVELQVAFVLILLSASGVAFLLAYNTRQVNFRRQVAIWLAGMAAFSVFATNMDLMTGTNRRAEPVVKVAKITEPAVGESPVRKPKRSRKNVLDLPTVDPVEIFVLTPEEKQYALDNPEVHDEIPE